MVLGLENKTQEYPRIQFIDRALRKGEETHYRCIECGQYISHDFIYSHKCRVIPKLVLLPLDVRVRNIGLRKKYLKAEIRARKMQLNLMRRLYGEKNGRSSY